jgi:enoyl-CoA hydratase/carnithine racemase
VLSRGTGGDGWIEVRLARPEKRNALCHALVDELTEVMGTTDAQAMVLGAEGPVFCAGGDRSETHTDPVASDRLLALLRDTPLFVIARVEGPVLGAGVAVVRRCPVAVGTEAATFSLPEATMGVFPSPAAYLEGAVGRRRILDVGLRGTPLPPGDLLTEVVDPDDVDAAVQRWVDVVRERPAVADMARRYWHEEVDVEAVARSDRLREIGLEGRATS